MLVGFSCFCGFVCCKFQYIIPCPQPGSLSCFRHQVPQLRPLRRRGWCWDEFCTPAIPSHAPRIPPKPRCPALPGAGPPGAAVLTCAGRSAALWLEHPWAAGAEPGQQPSPLGAAPRPGAGWRAPRSRAGSGAGEGAAPQWAHGPTQAFKGAVGANQPVGGSEDSPAGTAGIIGGSS